MRCPTALYAVIATSAFLGTVSCLDDSSELVQSSALVLDGPSEEEQSSKPSFQPLRQMKQAVEKAKSIFEKQLSDMTKRAVQDEVARQRAAMVPPPTEAPAALPETVQNVSSENLTVLTAEQVAHSAQQEEQRQMEMAKRSKYGEEWEINVLLPSGKTIASTAHSSTRLQSLMHSICKKLAIPYEDTKFLFNGTELAPMQTPAEFGLSDKDTIVVENIWLKEAWEADQQRAQKMAEKAAEQARQKKLREEEEAAEREVEAVRLRKEEKKRVEAEQVAARKHEMKEQGRVTLKFLDESGDPDVAVDIATKSDNWLQGTMELVCKRLDLDVSKTRFLRAKDMSDVHPHDTVKSLGLKENEKIIYRTPYRAKVQKK